MRFLFITGRELTYQRNDVLLRAFRRLGEVEELGVMKRPNSIILNSIKVSLMAVPKLLNKRYDLVFVGFYGQLLMYPVSLFSQFPVLFDAFVSTFDTVSSDRKQISPRSPISRFLISVDKVACDRASHVMLDTQAQADYFTDLYKIASSKISAIPVGCNEDIFYPRADLKPNSKTRVLYYSSYLPLHGVGTVVQAAHELRDWPVDFVLIGDGQEYKKTKELAAKLDLQNISFKKSIPLEDLPTQIAQADICLGGHFGRSEKAARVIPGKVYQILAMEKAMIASNRGANLDLLQHEDSAYLCNPDDPIDLAQAILYLQQNSELRKKIARRGREVYQAHASEEVITESLKSIVEGIVG